MNKKNVVILATGGTIAGVGEPGKNTGYVSGQISATELVSAIPELNAIANISVEQVCNVNSDDINGAIWLQLRKRIAELLPHVDGIVVTHGTDTMDETAFFLALTIKTDKPIVLTGAMRPATADEPDGPANLCGAVEVASASRNGGVFVYFGRQLFDAKLVQKNSASDLQPFGNCYPGNGALVFPFASPVPFFDVSACTELPKVNIVFFAVDSDPRMLECAANISDGVVIAGAGSGEFSQKFAEALAKVKIPVVVATRTNHGMVTLNTQLAPNALCAGFYPPQKAAVLLKLALATSQLDVFKQFC